MAVFSDFELSGFTLIVGSGFSSLAPPIIIDSVVPFKQEILLKRPEDIFSIWYPARLAALTARPDPLAVITTKPFL